MSVCRRISLSDLERFKNAFLEKFQARVYYDRSTKTTHFTTVYFHGCKVFIYVDKDDNTGFRYGYDSNRAKSYLMQVLPEFNHVS